MIKKYILILIKWYKKTEPTRTALAHNLHMAPTQCIYTPTCSEYMSEAIETYGVLKGVWMGVKRILRCNPRSKGGHDPVL